MPPVKRIRTALIPALALLFVSLAAAAALSLLKKSSAAMRYAVAAGALLCMVALPVATAMRLAASPTGPTVIEAPLHQTSPSSPGMAPVRGEGGREKRAGVMRVHASNTCVTAIDPCPPIDCVKATRAPGT